jgi:tetratricopeptide (TPR) repeat protein
VISVLGPLVLLAGLEIVLRIAGYGYPAWFFLHARLNGQKIIYDNQRFGWRFFPALSARTPRPAVLPAIKPPQTCRIFVFGESAAFGDPSPAFGLPRMLEVLLRNRFPRTHFEVVNAAMTAINSNVILPIARECAREQGDVWVVYMGNNEVVGPYGAGTVFGPQAPSLAFIRASIAVKGSKIGQMLADFWELLARGQSGEQPSAISLELFLNYKLRVDDARMEKVYAHFGRNLEDILQAGIQSGAQVVVSTVASNLKDCAPFASLHRRNLSESRKADWDRLYQTGIKAEEAGNLPAALEAFRQAEQIDDGYADLQFRHGRDLWRSGDFATARERFQHARDYDGLRFRADTRINGIISQVSSNRLRDGVGFVNGNEVLEQHSPHDVPGAELLYEHVHLNFRGNYWLARAFAEQIIALRPASLASQVVANGDWLSEEGCSAQLGLNDWDTYQTLKILRQRLQNAPFTGQLNNAEQYERLNAEIAVCQTSLAREKLSELVQRCEQALSLSPQDWVLHQNVAQLLGQSTEKPLRARAVEEWRRVIDLVPHYAEAHYELGVLLDQIGQAPEAETQLRLALRLKGNYYPNALNALGQVMAGQNRFAQAITAFEQALRLKPNFAEALVNLATALNRVGRTAEAKARLEEAVRLAPGQAEATRHLGQLLDQNGQLSEAMKDYTELVRKNPEDAIVHYKLAECLGLLGRSTEAQQHYTEALRLRPNFPEAHCQLGVELAQEGKPAEAIIHFSEAIRLKPDFAAAYKNLGVALARQQRFGEAVKEFEQAARLDPGDAVTQKYLQAARRSQGGAK